MIRSALTLLAFFCLADPSMGQTPPPAPASSAPRVESVPATEPRKLPEDFLRLADLRGKTNSEIATLELEAKALEETRIPRAKSARAQFEALKGRVAGLENKSKPTPAEQQQLERLKFELELRSNEVNVDPQALQDRLAQVGQQLTEKRALADRIQATIAEMLNPQQEFKRTMSIMFAGLIALVIGGFFVIAFRDEKIRQAIFSGETGIQFLTLFSLVIAIILFGITQILEGKELSALLGGLSGYILGRTIPRV